MKRLIQKFKSAMMIFLATIVSMPFASVGQAMALTTNYYPVGDNAIPIEVQLTGTSTNDHTVPYWLWTYDGNAYVAVESTHKMTDMTIGAYNSLSYVRHEAGDAIQIGDGGVLNPNNSSGNTNDSHWTIFKFDLAAILSNPTNFFTFSVTSTIVGKGHWIVNATFTVVIPKVTVNIYKTWVGGPMNAPINVNLYKTANGTTTLDRTIMLTPDMNGQATYQIANLDYTNLAGQIYIYSFEESDPGEGYHVTHTSAYDSETRTYNFALTNTYTSPMIDIAVEKVWQGGSARPEITANLLQNGTIFRSVILNSDNNWSNTWSVPKTTDNGVVYTYSLEEVEVEGYLTAVTNEGLNYVITNTYQIPRTDVTATKTWVNGPETKPTVWFQLWRQVGEAEASIVPDAEIKELATGLESVTWTNIDKTDIDGNEYTFSVKEVDASGNDFTPTNYSKREAGLNVTNTYVVPTADIVVIKKWVDQFTNHPEIEVDLLRDGETFLEEVAILDAKNDWTYVWEDVALTDEDGVAYEFEVVEISQIKQYETSIIGSLEDGFLIVNTWQEPGKGGAPIVTPPNTGHGSSITSLMVLGSCLTLIGVFGIKRYNY